LLIGGCRSSDNTEIDQKHQNQSRRYHHECSRSRPDRPDCCFAHLYLLHTLDSSLSVTTGGWNSRHVRLSDHNSYRQILDLLCAGLRHPATLPQVCPIAGDAGPPLSETALAISVNLVDFVNV
jgi:hypothetical protein